MKLEELKKYQQILILGYGIEGKATEAFLKKYHPEAAIIIADKNHDPDYLQKQDSVDLVIKTPGISPKLVTKPYTTATNVFFANTKATTIGITGSKGKSTTAALTHHILKTAGKPVFLAGNIGTPMIELLDQDLSADDIVVLELSSYQLQDINYSPNISCILNFYLELHNHDSFDDYKKAKFNIVAHSTGEDRYIYNPAFKEFASIETQAQKIPFSDLPANFDQGNLRGQSNKDNIRAAYTIVSLLGVPAQTVRQAMSTFAPLPHRMQLVGTFDNITFINDSAATHPKAAISAIEVTDNIGTIILGGQDRGFELDNLINEVVSKKITNIVLFPDTGADIAKKLSTYTTYKPNILETDSMEAAVKFAYEHTQSNQTCLLSPGFPSYLTFDNFAQRGDRFMYYVKQHAKTAKTHQEIKNS